MFDSVTINALTSALDGLAQRQRAISDNIANINTPNYPRQACAVRRGARTLDRCGRRSGRGATVGTSLEPTRLNGNNVNLDNRDAFQHRHDAALPVRNAGREQLVHIDAHRDEDLMTFDAIGIAGTGLTVHRKWLDAISDNIANINTAAPSDGAAFRAR